MNILKTKGLRWGSFLLLSLILSYVNVLQAAEVPPELGEIVGRVFNQHGDPEAGVWVIAEAQEGLPVPYRKIVVTDDNGYFVVPELPRLDNDYCGENDVPNGEHGAGSHAGHKNQPCNKYDVWAQGYGIRESKHIFAKPKRNVDPMVSSDNEEQFVNVIKFKVHRYDGYDPNDPTNNENMSAVDAREDASGYPANYWWSMFKPLTLKTLFPAPYVPPSRKTSTLPYGFFDEKPSPHWFVGRFMKAECLYCHQLGRTFQRYTSKEQWVERQRYDGVDAPAKFDFQEGDPNYLACEDFVDPDPDWYDFLPYSSPHDNPWVIYVKKVEYTEVGDKLEYAIYDLNAETFIEDEIGTLIPTCGVSIDDLSIPLDLGNSEDAKKLKKCILDVAAIRRQIKTLSNGTYSPPNPYRLLPTAEGERGIYLLRFNGEVYYVDVGYEGNPLHIVGNVTQNDEDGVLQSITWPSQCPSPSGKEYVSTTFSDAVQSVIAKTIFNAGFKGELYKVHGPLIDRVAMEMGVDKDTAIDFLFDGFEGWAQQVKSGAYPDEIPPRPKGQERNVVITQWDSVADNFYVGAFVHDVVSTEKQNPANPIYRNGKVWGVATGAGNLIELDPTNHTVAKIDMPFSRPTPYRMTVLPPTWEESTYTSPHNPMLDKEGNLWITAAFRPAPLFATAATTDPSLWRPFFPAFATQGPFQDYMFNMGVILNPLGEAYPGPRQLVKFYPDTGQFETIDTGYDTHHLHFDSQGVLWMSGDWRAVGTFHNPGNVGDEAGVWNSPFGPLPIGPLYHGFTPPLVVGDQEYAYEFHYGLIPNEYDIAPPANLGNPMLSILTTTPYDFFGGGFTRFVPQRMADPNNPDRLIPTGYGVYPGSSPYGEPFGPISFYPAWWPGYFYNGTLEYFRYGQGNVPRGVDVTLERDTNGDVIGSRVFTAFAGTGEIAEFTRNDAVGIVSLRGLGGVSNAFDTSGWTLWPTPGPKITLENNETQTADFYYYVWVDQADTIGFGQNMVVVTGSNSDSLIVFDPYVDNPSSDTGKGDVIAQIRVPYPQGFYSRGLDGRIDKPVCADPLIPDQIDCYYPGDPDIWKGKGWWTPYSFPIRKFENGKVVEMFSPIVKLQLRNNPLDR